MKLTQKQKIDQFDALAAERTKWELATYDLVNHRFGVGITYTAARIREAFDSAWEGGTYTVQMSFRAMPLFLVRYCAAGQADQVSVLTEDEVQQLQPASVFARIVTHARNELIAKAVIRREREACHA